MFSWNKSHHLKTGKCWFRGELPGYSLIKTWLSIAHNGKVGNKYYIKLSDVDLFSEKAMATHSSTLAWKIPWTEEPGGLQSMGSRRVGHNWVTSLSLFTFMHWRRKWQPTPASYLENPRDGGAWWAAVYGVAQSRTWLKQLSSRFVLEQTLGDGVEQRGWACFYLI